MNDPLPPEVAILNAALELHASERIAYLDQACAGDAALRRQVEALLQAHEQAENFLDAPPAGFDFRRTLLVSAPLREKAGDRIGRYKLLQQIGEGGCGVVYMAEQEEPVRRRVALKVIKLGMDTQQVIARFEAERQALAMMDHPNIAKVLDAGATKTGRPYFVMELVRGIKITDYCDQGNLSTRERLDLFGQTCRAIQHAHQKGIIHRDIKPSNILITVNDGVPVPKVIDFGIAKATQGRLTDKTLFTAFEQFIGTPAYMSPEQAVMTSLDIDTRSDIYSLGVLLYELLTGKTPFDANELFQAGLDEMRRTIREKEPQKPSTRLSTMLDAERTAAAKHRQTEPPRLVHLVRGDLDWIAMKCLEKDRARRYETANGLAADVQRHLDNEPVIARPPGGIYRLQKMVRRNRLAVATSLLVVMALLLALGVLVASNLRITREKHQKDLALKERGIALDAARQSEQDARTQLLGGLRSQAQARRASRLMGQRLESLAALTEAARIRPDESLRDDAIAAMSLPDIRRGPTWPGFPVGTKNVVFDEQYQHYARLDGVGIISIRRVVDDQEVQRINWGAVLPEQIPSLFFSPDGKLLAALNQDLQIWRLADGQTIFSNTINRCHGAAFSSDSRQIAVGQNGRLEKQEAGGNRIALFDLTSGQESKRWPVPARVHVLAFNPRSSKLAVGYSDSTIVSVFDATEARLLTELAMARGTVHGLAWHPDGGRLAIAGSDPRIQIWGLDPKRRLAILEGHESVVTALTFSPDGRLLASAGWDLSLRLWDAGSARQLMQFPSYSGTTPQFSSDGRWIGCVRSGENLQLLEVARSREHFTLASRRGVGVDFFGEGDISPDGRLLAAGMSEGVGLWELPEGKELTFLPIGPVPSAFFSNDGSELFTCGLAGLQRWPLHWMGRETGQFELGPPRRIKLPFSPTRASRSRDGRTVAVISEAAGGSVIMDLTTESVRGDFLPHARACYGALSPDGQWMASSGWHSMEVRLWKAQTGEMLREWPERAMRMVIITPDSRSLIISEDNEFTFWDLQSLQLQRRLPHELQSYPSRVVFSPDGKLMALSLSPGIIDLREVATIRTVARLEYPVDSTSTPVVFSPAGTELVTSASHAMYLWDLRAIRVRLKAMGLDWDWPEFPPPTALEAAHSPSAAPPLKVQVLNAPE